MNKEGLISKFLGIGLIAIGILYIPMHILAVSTDFADETTLLSYAFNPGFFAIALGFAFTVLGKILKKKAESK